MQLDPGRGYDLIGDVHGCAHTLDRLLDLLGYRLQGGVWRHPRRQALFLGDIVDRGPRIREALHWCTRWSTPARRCASWATTNSTRSAGAPRRRPAAAASTSASIRRGMPG